MKCNYSSGILFLNRHILSLAFCILYFTAFAQDNSYKLHTVVKGETLYSLCKRYGVTMTDVIELNNMGSNGYSLAIGQTLKIPNATVQQITEAKYTRVSADAYITHIVKQGETLFSISRNYNGVTVQMLREKNELKSDTLKINQKLLIPQEINVKSAYKEVKKTTISQNLPLEKQFLAAENNAGSVDISRGIASWFNGDSEENMKNFYALHKTLPLGTVMKVRNLMNNRITFVKVVGKLPDIEENKNITLKVSGAAAYALQVLDAKFLVEITIPQTADFTGQSKK